jgi:cbb3-type cytochrome oxidase cytochrome c subunit
MKITTGIAGVVFVLLAALGCGKGTPPPAVVAAAAPAAAAPAVAAPAAAVAFTGPFAVGRQVFAKQNCARCHKIGEAGSEAAQGGDGEGGEEGGGRRRGPDLSAVGGKHERDWIADHIFDPKTHSQRSRMPAYGQKISESALDALADYLASLK